LDVQFMTLKEASKFLRIGVMTLNRLIRNEGLLSNKTGGMKLLEKWNLLSG
jgi:excisionase family DNA binding protein